MLQVADQYRIRQAYYIEKKSQREIAREFGYSRNTIKKAIEQEEAFKYRRQQPAQAPVLGPYKERLKELVEANRDLPRKQRYTARKMYDIIREEGYQGAESTVRYHVAQLRKATRKRRVYIPLEYEPGVDMQMDWGEAVVELFGEVTTVKLFNLRWCYSRKLFVCAYPSEKQECFLDGHARAFHYFGGVPQRIIYDNLKPAVQRILTGRNREEQALFLAFRNHYVFESRYCNPASGHEKGGVENDVGYARRNFLAGCPAFADYEELNAYLLEQCQLANERTIYGQPHSVAEAWQIEQPHIRVLPPYDFACCVAREVKVNKYSQIQFETNRYSVPTDEAYRTVTVRAFPFRIEILHRDQVLATHPRSYARAQDISDPLHYLPLLEQRPGAFEHAQPMRQLRANWEPVYDDLLAHLQGRLSSSRAIREFVRILSLHRCYPPDAVTAAVRQALNCGSAHLDNVTLCLHQTLLPEVVPPQLDLSMQPALAEIGQQPIDLAVYDQLLTRGQHMSTNAQLEQHLKTLHLAAFLDQYADLAHDAQQAGWSYEQFLLELAEQEVTRRTLNRQQRLIRQAKFPLRKELADFDFTMIPDLNRSRLLHLADASAYVSAAEPVIFVGNPGLGKSHLAISLGLAACRQGYKTRFYNTAALVNELTLAQTEQRLPKLFASALKHQLIILDELGFIPFSSSGAQLLFQFCSTLHEQVALIVTTNLAFSDWPQVFGDAKLTAALIDRLTYQAHIFEFRGQSYRFLNHAQEVTTEPIMTT